MARSLQAQSGSVDQKLRRDSASTFQSYTQKPETNFSSINVQVKSKLLEFVRDYGIEHHSQLLTRVDTVERKGQGFLIKSTDVLSNKEKVISSKFICVTSGILSHDQWELSERGVDVKDDFMGDIVYAAKRHGQDCPLGAMNLTGKNVVVLGSGSFAAEAVEISEKKGSSDITIVGRPRYRLILPFSRQYTVSAIANAPFLPWSIRMKLALRYVKNRFYKQCNLMHWFPKGKPKDMDFSGQCHDAYFRLAHQGKLSCLVDHIECLSGSTVFLKSGTSLPCDVLVVASGLKYNLKPSFLGSMDLDYSKLHNFAFLGKNPRIGCAADFLFAYVPYGPLMQLEMFFHSIKCCMNGLEDAIYESLQPTPLPNHGDGFLSGGRMAGSYTFFEYSHWWSFQSKAVSARVESMLRTLDVGRSPLEKADLRFRFLYRNMAEWVRCVGRSMQEMRRFKIFGPSRPIQKGGTFDQNVHVTC